MRPVETWLTDEIGAAVGLTHDDQTNEKGRATMKLTTTAQVSVDGVMQGNGGPDENRSGGFERGGWARPPKPLFDNEAMTFVHEIYQRAEAFLFGRRTYELFAGYWGERSGGPHRRCLEHAAQVRRIDHAHRPAMGEHDRLSVTSRRPSAS